MSVAESVLCSERLWDCSIRTFPYGTHRCIMAGLDPSRPGPLTVYPTRVSQYKAKSRLLLRSSSQSSFAIYSGLLHKPSFTSEQRQVSNFLRIEHSAPAGIPLLSVFFPFPDSLLTSLNVYLICFNACSLEPASTSSLLYTFI